MQFYISDYHFYQPEFISWRGFSSLEEMHDAMIAAWNSRVTEADTVYILGDLSHGSGEETNALLRRLRGSKVLLRGNHDAYTEDPLFDRSLLADIRDILEVSDGDRRVVLCHYPMPFYPGQYQHCFGNGEARMLYGHLHSSFDETLLNAFVNRAGTLDRRMEGLEAPVKTTFHMINCFCRFSAYVPLTLEEWIAVDAARRARLPAPEQQTWYVEDYPPAKPAEA